MIPVMPRTMSRHRSVAKPLKKYDAKHVAATAALCQADSGLLSVQRHMVDHILGQGRQLTAAIAAEVEARGRGGLGRE